MKVLFVLSILLFFVTNSFAQVGVKLIDNQQTFSTNYKNWARKVFNTSKINELLEKNVPSNNISMMYEHAKINKLTNYIFDSPLKFKQLSFGESLGASVFQSILDTYNNNALSNDRYKKYRLDVNTGYKEQYR